MSARPDTPWESADFALVHVEDLAKALGYSGATSSFREWCASMRITPVPGRVGWYDPRLVRRRLDEAQGLMAPSTDPAQVERPMSYVEQRRARRGAA
jgi:hypothetical protein